MIAHQPERQIHLEWMLQNGQVDDRALTRALVQMYFASLVQVARILIEEEERVMIIAHQAICDAVGKRHLYTGETPLRAWLCAFVYRLCRKSAGLARLKSVESHLLLYLRYIHDLTLPEIGFVVGQNVKKVAPQLELARQRFLAEHSQPLVAERTPAHTQFIPLIRQALDGLLNEADRAQLDVHLAGCETCLRIVEQIQVQDELIERLLSADLPAEYLQEDLAAVQDQIDRVVVVKNRRRGIRLSFKEITLPLVAVLVVACLSWAGGIFKPERGRSVVPPETRIVYKRITATPRLVIATTVATTRGDEVAPTVTPTPLRVILSPTGVRLNINYVLDAYLSPNKSQGSNNSGPVSLALVLNFWGLQYSSEKIAGSLMPNPLDENVMAYELENFVAIQTRLKVLQRVGGDVETIQKLIRAGFPVIVETGQVVSAEVGWIGCYQVVTGYAHNQGNLVLSLKSGCAGPRLVDEEQFVREWRAFNYAFLVIYHGLDETRILNILGRLASKEESAQIATDRAALEMYRTEGVDRFFAWFNRGSSLAELDDFGGAARDFDEAFAVYQALPEIDRPWRILWYQTRPYWAYYYTGRYQDLIDLATRTISSTEEPVLEESFYWRGLAREALGDKQGAVADLREAVEINPHFSLGLAQLNRLAE